MEPRKIAQKLDGIEIGELGIDLDSSVLWDQLENKLNENGRWKKPWLVAACIVVLILLTPIRLLEPSTSIEDVAVTEIAAEVSPIEDSAKEEVVAGDQARPTFAVMEIRFLDRKESHVGLAAVQAPTMDLTPVFVEKTKKKIDAQFNYNDISVIQAQLGKPEAEKGRKVTVRAQLYPSSNDSEINFRELKIKLNAKNK